MALMKAFERIRGFGVFVDYSRPQNIEPFGELNIIYGWNYSGKTTLSRILRSIEAQSIHKDYENASFEISTEANSTITETSLKTAPEKVRVFNSDFVKENISWDGDAFEPILLLGQESIEAQEELEKNEEILERLRNCYRSKNTKINQRNEELREKKKAKAKSIKQTLQIVDAYNAAHLNQDIARVEEDAQKYVINSEKLTKLQQSATADEKSKLPKIKKLTLDVDSGDLSSEMRKLLARIPEMTNTIQHLADHPEVARWIRNGLPLHVDKSNCEFCGNPLGASRIESLRAHFSEDVELLERALKIERAKCEALKLSAVELHKSEFYTQCQSDFANAQIELISAQSTYNEAVDRLIATIDKKLSAPFEVFTCPSIDETHSRSVTKALTKINNIIEENNSITDSFDEEKERAISALKLHFAADFYIEERIPQRAAMQSILGRHLDWYEASAARIRLRNEQLEAQISQAQKGREELNLFIGKFLVGSNVSVDVVNVDGTERFRLLRDTDPAKNLSEGERTAIAYAFFLIKLKEATDLSELIVCIDDPVSSLDSNHIFQVFSATRSFFCWQDSSDENKWKLRVAQLFISTHNFEFLSLVKDLPIRKPRRKYYFVKRMDINKSTLMAMPKSIIRYNSEYQYLWSVINDFHNSPDKTDLEQLLSLPNALRRFVELYTYSKCPSDATVDRRADIVFGSEKSRRILKLLHHFSHSNNLLGMGQNNDLICDIENVVDDLISIVQEDRQHYDALMSALA